MEFWHGNDDAAWDDAQHALHALGVTDGLPVIPPTQARVAQMLSACGLDAAGVVASLPIAMEPLTWQDVAINAVMAGCLPAYLPVVGAALNAVADDAFNLIGIATTTGSATPMIIVNGPIATQLHMNAAGNALGPGNRANATIGRALSLALRNLGQVKPDGLDMATLGQPAKYTCCLAENTSASPWAGLHVDRGFAENESVVTVAGISGSVEIVDAVSRIPEDLVQTFANSMLIAGTLGGGARGILGGGEPLLIMPPEIADTFHRGGWTKAQTKQAIFEASCMPLDRLSAAVRAHLKGLRAHPPADTLADAPLRIAREPADLMILVAGGVGVKAAYLPTWGGSTRAVSRVLSGSGSGAASCE